MKSTFSILILALLMTACTKPQGSNFQQRKVDRVVNPIALSDQSQGRVKAAVNISEDVSSQNLIVKSSYFENERVNYFKEAKLIYDFAIKNGLSSVETKVSNQLARIYKEPSYMSQSNIKDSPYSKIFQAMSHPEYLSATKNLQDEFEREATRVLSMLHKTKLEVEYPSSPITLHDTMEYLAKFMSSFEKLVKNSKTLNPAIKEGIVDALYERFWLKLPKAQQQIADFEQSRNLNEAIDVLMNFITSFEMELTEAEVAQLEEAKEIGKDLNRVLSAKETLALLIEIWEGMTPAERKTTFADVSPELHEFLDEKSIKARECLKMRKCKKIGLRIARNLFILPKIKKMGIQNIQAQVQTAAFEELNSQLSASIDAAIKDMDKRLYTEIKAELDREYAYYYGLRKTFPDYASQEMQTWFQEEFGATKIPALEDASLVMAEDYRALKKSKSLTFDAEVFGDALSTTNILLRSNSISKSFAGLIKVNQLLANGGFSLVNNNNSESLLRLRGQSSQAVNVQKSATTNDYLSYHSGVTPDGFKVTSTRIPAKLTGAQFTAMMRGMREMVELFADWKKSAWPSIAKQLNVKDILANLPNDNLDQSAAPQDAMLGLAVGNLAMMVSNFSAAGSPLFYYCPEGRNAWFSQGEECARVTTQVSFNPDRSTTKIFVKDHAELMIEIMNFHKLIDDLQKSQSSYLKKQDNNGMTPLKQLAAAQEDLDLLVFGLSQFLSSVYMDPLGRIASSFDIADRKGDFSQTDMQASLTAISALARAAEFRETPIYGKNAYAAFEYLLLAHYDEDLKNFRSTSGRPSRVTQIMALNTIDDLLNVIEDPEQIERLQGLKSTWTSQLKL